MRGYKPLPSHKPLPLLRLADGRSAEEWMADFDRRHGIIPAGDVIECDYEVWADDGWQRQAPSSYEMWGEGMTVPCGRVR